MVTHMNVRAQLVSSRLAFHVINLFGEANVVSSLTHTHSFPSALLNIYVYLYTNIYIYI